MCFECHGARIYDTVLYLRKGFYVHFLMYFYLRNLTLKIMFCDAFNMEYMKWKFNTSGFSTLASYSERYLYGSAPGHYFDIKSF